MRKQTFNLVLAMLLSASSVAQIIFEKGYFIDESNQKTECLIKNIDWKNNPKVFKYKRSQDQAVQKASIESVKEFAIGDDVKYIRVNVAVDRSSDEVNSMSYDREPVFREERVLLKVLIEGKASLFQYKDGDLTRFFYKMDGAEIQPLVYKRYLDGNKIEQNNLFRQQLLADLKCPSIAWEDVESLEYANLGLEDVFIQYNECQDAIYTKYGANEKKDLFNLTIRPGFNHSHLIMKSASSDLPDIDFDKNTNFRLGLEAEFILPYTNNKWGLFIEPTYRYYQAEQTIADDNVVGKLLVSKVDYRAVELPLGARHYFFLNHKTKLFTDVFSLFDFHTNSYYRFERIDGSKLNSLKVLSNLYFGLGVGLKQQDKYSFGMRYHLNREIFANFLAWDSRYQTFSIYFGYAVF
ncbi:MAG TPA: hypothetical protein PKA00_02625 [Saprospiraceae bacterium]|nr:hypothetical protein [Saprospiraceae bacterium]HMQ81768.1 hypothetical protein [Saprospiraceae bacterium]